MITVQCSNPDQIKLKVTAELTIGQWREIIDLTRGIKYYYALDELLGSIRRGIAAIETREDVEFLAKEPSS